MAVFFFLTGYNPFFAPRTHSTDRRVCAVKKIIYNVPLYYILKDRYLPTRKENVCRANSENASTHILRSASSLKDHIIITIIVIMYPFLRSSSLSIIRGEGVYLGRIIFYSMIIMPCSENKGLQYSAR